MKRIICLLLISVMIFSLAACGSPKPKAEELNPLLTLDAFLKALKARDMDALQLYYEGDVKDLSPEEQIEDPLVRSIVDEMIAKMLDFDYTLDNEKVDGNNATVDMVFMTYDFEAIIKDLIDKALSNAANLNFWSMDPDTIANNLKQFVSENYSDILKNAKKDKTMTVTVKLVKKGGKWMVKDLNKSDDFMYALSGGLSKFREGFGSLFG